MTINLLALRIEKFQALRIGGKRALKCAPCRQARHALDGEIGILTLKSQPKNLRSEWKVVWCDATIVSKLRKLDALLAA